MKKLLRALLLSVPLLGLSAGLASAQGVFQGYPFASTTTSSRSAATIPMTGNECIPGDTRLSGGRAPQTSCYTTGNLKGNYKVTVTDGTTIAADYSTGAALYQLTLGGNRDIVNPSSIVTGQRVFLFITQDGTGSRTVNWSSMYQFVGSSTAYGTKPTLTTTPSRGDLFELLYTGNYIQVVGPSSQGRLP